jgi:aspartate/methionine/tyrosine aminotransferase
MVRPVERLQQNLAISVPTLSQIAAEAAFDGAEEMEQVKRGYQENRRTFTSDSFEFAKKMLQQAHVAATPGIDFDPIHGHRFIRFSYARSAEDMREAVARLARWLA